MNNNLLKIIGYSLISSIIFGSFYIFKFKDKRKKINIFDYYEKNFEKLSNESTFLNFEGCNLEYRAFYVACAVEHNVNILSQIIEQCNININQTNVKGNDGFMIACCNNINLHIIQFLASFPNQDIIKKNINLRDAFSLACQYNDNLQIIKFLAEMYNLLDVNKNNIYKMSAIIFACENKNNINFIKYLIEITNIYQIKFSLFNRLFDVLIKNKNLEIMLYLIEDLKINITEFNFFKKICKYISSEEKRLYYIQNLKKSNYIVYTNIIENITNNQKKIYDKIKFLKFSTIEV